MSQIVKAFLGIFLTLFMTASAMGILGAYLEVMNAQDMQACFVDEMENSDYNPGVIKECMALCEKEGYQLTVTLFSENQVVTTIHSQAEVPASAAGADMAKVELVFPFRVAFFGIRKEHKLVSYAR
ncbi:MAG: hypothetical protein MR508_00415 [Lachnospiraceae bacterium]|nr:hypothetical protein [Lachnospiraceae bacterium]